MHVSGLVSAPAGAASEPDLPGLPMTGLVVGATGAVGTALARHLAASERWTVIGISRRIPAQPVAGVTYVSCDLAAPVSACAAALAKHPPVTHVFYCARVTHSDEPVESVGENLQLLRTVTEAAGRVSRKLRHVHLVQGGKYYGVHLGPFPTPAREGQGRCSELNFYHAQEDFLRSRARQGVPWEWSSSRPNTLLHYSPDIARNIVSSLGCYAALCGELGLPLDFPGPAGAYESLTQVTTLGVLARSMEAITTTPSCSGKAFNVTNTDLFRWSAVWPELARQFGVQLGTVRPSRLAETMKGREHVWRRICQRRALRSTEVGEVANWAFVDATLERYWDEILCHNRARRHGLLAWDDSVRRFFKILGDYREARVLP